MLPCLVHPNHEVLCHEPAHTVVTSALAMRQRDTERRERLKTPVSTHLQHRNLFPFTAITSSHCLLFFSTLNTITRSLQLTASCEGVRNQSGTITSAPLVFGERLVLSACRFVSVLLPHQLKMSECVQERRLC